MYKNNAESHYRFLCEQNALGSSFYADAYNILKKRNEKLFEKIDDELTLKSLIKKTKQLNRSVDGWRKNFSIITNFINKNDIKNRMAGYFENNHIKTIAFWGNSELRNFLTPIFKNLGIKICYLVEDGKFPNSDIPVFSRKETELPNTDLMIITDSSSADVIKEHIDRDFTITALTCAQFIGAVMGTDVSLSVPRATTKKRNVFQKIMRHIIK